MSRQFSVLSKGKGKGKETYSNLQAGLRICDHRYGNSHAIWDHTVLSATGRGDVPAREFPGNSCPSRPDQTEFAQRLFLLNGWICLHGVLDYAGSKSVCERTLNHCTSFIHSLGLILGAPGLFWI